MALFRNRRERSLNAPLDVARRVEVPRVARPVVRHPREVDEPFDGRQAVPRRTLYPTQGLEALDSADPEPPAKHAPWRFGAEAGTMSSGGWTRRALEEFRARSD